MITYPIIISSCRWVISTSNFHIIYLSLILLILHFINSIADLFRFNFDHTIGPMVVKLLLCYHRSISNWVYNSSIVSSISSLFIRWWSLLLMSIKFSSRSFHQRLNFQICSLYSYSDSTLIIWLGSFDQFTSRIFIVVIWIILMNLYSGYYIIFNIHYYSSIFQWFMDWLLLSRMVNCSSSSFSLLLFGFLLNFVISIIEHIICLDHSHCCYLDFTSRSLYIDHHYPLSSLWFHWEFYIYNQQIK